MAAFDEGEPGSRSFALWAEPRLRRAFMAAYGVERGRDATAEALGAGWEYWEQVRKMVSPLGYCYRAGQSRTRSHKLRVVYSIPDYAEPDPSGRHLTGPTGDPRRCVPLRQMSFSPRAACHAGRP